MSMDHEPEYAHAQRGPWSILLGVLAAAFLAAAWPARQEPAASVVLVAAGLLTGVLATAMHRLTVEDRGDRLAVRFGPLPLFRTTVPYADIEAVEVGRTWLLEGWGIHYSVRAGWVWNIRGRACVRVRTRHRVLWVGTDDAENLARFLATKAVPAQR
jgi:hypothetical protein